MNQHHDLAQDPIRIGFRDVAAAVVNAGGPPDKAKLLAVMTQYGLQPAALAPSVASLRRVAGIG